MGLYALEAKKFKKANLTTTILVLAFLLILITIPLQVVSSDIDVASPEAQKIPGGRKREVWFYIDLNNTGDEEVICTLIIDSIKRYKDPSKISPGSTIIPTLSGDREQEFRIPSNEQETARLKLAVQEHAPGGQFFVPLTLKINDTEENLPDDTVLLEIEEVHEIELEIPGKGKYRDIKSGDRVDYEVKITNNGNMEEKINFELKDYPTDWEYPGSDMDGLYFSENPLIIPSYNPNKGYLGEGTVSVVVNVPDDLEIDEDIGVYETEMQVIAKMEVGNNPDPLKLRIEIVPPTEGDDEENHTKEGGFIERLPFPRKYVFAFPIIAILGGMGIIVASRKKDVIAVPSWAEDEDYYGEDYDEEYDEEEEVVEGLEEEIVKKPKIKAKPLIKCPKCKVSIRVSSSKRPLSITCPKCTVKFTLKGKEEEKAKPTSITCPKCQSKMKVTSAKRPLTILCFKCKAKIVLKAKGAKAPPKTKAKGKTIKCPKCKVSLKIATEKRPLTIHCPKCKSKIVLQAKEEVKPQKPKQVAKPKTIKCPKCKIKLKITTEKRPLTIFCPKCKAKVVLKGKEEHKPPRPKPAEKPTTIKCPKCKASLKIASSKRPLTIHCPKCKSKVVLKGKEKSTSSSPKQKPQKRKPDISSGVKPATIKCPKCKTSLKVTNPKRPLTIHCPKCKSKVVLKGKEGAKQTPQKTTPKKQSGAKPVTIKCPKCKTTLKVANPKRPLTVGCPKCKTKLKLK